MSIALHLILSRTWSNLQHVALMMPSTTNPYVPMVNLGYILVLYNIYSIKYAIDPVVCPMIDSQAQTCWIKSSPTILCYYDSAQFEYYVHTSYMYSFVISWKARTTNRQGWKGVYTNTLYILMLHVGGLKICMLVVG